jgi:hypothetical protein
MEIRLTSYHNEKSSTVLETQYIAPLRFKPITVNNYKKRLLEVAISHLFLLK